MTRKVTATEAKNRILRLLDEAEDGEEIEITRHGRPVARLVPPSGARSLEGSFEGVATTAVEDDQELFSTGERRNTA
jgi:prevent-host-death family protein